MKKWFIKYKVLLNGFSVTDKYERDGFILKTGTFDKKLLGDKYEPTFEGVDVDIYRLLYSSCINDSNKLTYRYLESIDFKEIEVSNNTNNNNFHKIVKKDEKIMSDILDIQKKMRIIFNVPVLFQCINVEFYDENKKFVNCYQVIFSLTPWNRLTYAIDPKEFSNNSRFGFDINVMKQLDNNYFKRAVELFDDSFESIKITNRFLLMFSSLEAIFNLDAEDITERLAKYTAKLLAEDNKESYKTIYNDMKNLYNKRSKYIHGSKMNSIKEKDEQLLRKYVRRIIIIYWYLALITKKDAKQILDYLDSDEKLDVQLRLFISSIVSNNFSEQQHKLIKQVEEEIGQSIPPKTKDNILKNCDKNDYN